MAHSPEKAKGRKGNGRFAGIPHAVMNHPDYIALSAKAVRLLLEMARQYNGYNNGDLSAPFSTMRKRGVANSKTTLARLLRELVNKNFLIYTRPWRLINPGGRCALFALTWLAVDECPGKELELKPTRVPLRTFTAEIVKMPCPVIGTPGISNCDTRGVNNG